MRIAVVVDPHFPVPPLKYGGTERSVAYLIEALLRMNHQVTLFGPGNSTVSCPVVACSEKNIDMGWDSSLEDAVKKAIDTNMKHIIEKQDNFDVISWHGKFHKDIQKFYIPVLFSLRNPLPYSVAPNEVTILKKLPNVFVNAISEQYTREYPQVPYLTSIYNGLPTDIFPFTPHPKTYLSFLGRFSVDKQPHIALQAAIALKKPLVIGARLDRFGQDYFNEYCKKYMDNSLIDFRGEVTDAEKIEILRYAQINLHPISFPEPFGLSVVEAGLCGTPTIAFDKGSMRELIHEGVSGFVVQNLDELTRVYPKALALDRKKVRDHFLQFNDMTMAKKYVAAFETIIEKTPAL